MSFNTYRFREVQRLRCPCLHLWHLLDTESGLRTPSLNCCLCLIGVLIYSQQFKAFVTPVSSQVTCEVPGWYLAWREA